uniref:Uncharacterized LOC107718445 n=1 Tax=Sinocyclocheilus rhinocerous TaxID=307959 RepID=A0A673MHA6_9TELE
MYDISLPVPHSLTSEYDTPILLPSVCVNGNPVETSPLTHHPPSLILQQPQPELTKPITQKSGQPQATTLLAKPQKTDSNQPKSQKTQLPKSESKPRPEPLLPVLGVLQKGSSLSLQNLSHREEEKQSGGPVDGRRWSFDKPGEEEKAAIVAALEQAGRVTDEVEMKTVIPAGETETQSKKRRGLFSHGKGDSAGKGPIASKEEAEHAQPLVEVKHKGWFSSKDSHSKPSPHPVKPLTPPDEKRSEGRSVLEKLKSTIHSGRTGQDADKKPLVEGGGSYYHLNHSELVNLLIQRDTELRQEREEYEKRGALLEKRETELKKMKFLIKDLEDYIDTLLVRIMEQTPTLLQVRPKMK